MSQEGDTFIYRQQWDWSDRLGISGIIDAIEERDGLLIPLDSINRKLQDK